MAVRAWRTISLCAGVGGLDLGVRLAEPAARSVCYVEREAAASAVLVARMEDGWLHPAPIWSDLATFDPEPWRGAVDCVVSGDPCQPNSNAGLGLGADDDRWLADRVVDVFDRSGAARLFRENVTGNADGQIEYFVPALESLGCRVAIGIFSAKQLGFSHGWERMFIMADRDGDADGRANVAGRVRSAARTAEGEAWGKDGQRRGPGPGDGGKDVELGRLAHSYGDGCAARSDVPEQASRGGADGELARSGGALVAHGDGAGRRTGGGARLHRAGQARALAQQPCHNELADPYGAGLSQRTRPQDGRGALGNQGPSAGASGDLPLFCPGPSDPRWPQILAHAPHLAPALSRLDEAANAGLLAADEVGALGDPVATERAVRRMAHGMADRVDRLRDCGNGVVPLVGGYAWATLSALLAASAGTGLVDLRAA